MSDDAVPPQVQAYADRAVEYVRRAVGVALEFDSDTLPLLDHYLRNVPPDQAEAIALIATTAGAYFGEVVRRHIGGRWDVSDADAKKWRVFLPAGLNFAPASLVTAAIEKKEFDDEVALEAPERMKPYVEQALSRMGNATVDEYYSLCGRLDTIEHLHEVLVAVAAQLLGDPAPTDEADDVAEKDGSEAPAATPTKPGDIPPDLN